jgi:RimJ/RimL family protein N-acetyltransferase
MPRERTPDDDELARLALHPHGFSTGRLILRDILDHEIPQFKRILTTRENHSYAGAEPGLDNISSKDLQTFLSKDHREKERIINLFIILKAELDVKLKLKFDRVPHMVNGGHVIGYISLTLDYCPIHDSGAYIGIIIDHQARKHHFSQEVLIAALDYILLGRPTKLRNGNLGGLGLSKACMETAVENGPFRGLIESLNLTYLEREGTPDHGQPHRMPVPCVTYTVNKDQWLQARKNIIMDWMPAGQQTLSRDGSPNLIELARSHTSGSGHASGSGHTSGSGHGASTVHLFSHQRYGWGACGDCQ